MVLLAVEKASAGGVVGKGFPLEVNGSLAKGSPDAKGSVGVVADC